MALESDELREKMEHTASPFDRQVAVTMAIVAAVLASVTMLSHRAQNETLLLQADSNRIQTQANIYHTEASDQWNFYQAKNIRNYETQAYLAMLSVITKAPGSAPLAGQLTAQWSTQLEKYKKELPELQATAEGLVKRAKELEAESQERLKESYRTHQRGERYEVAELGVELALVLCSVAILTKRRPFWYSGVAIGLVGLAVAISGVMMK